MKFLDSIQSNDFYFYLLFQNDQKYVSILIVKYFLRYYQPIKFDLLHRCQTYYSIRETIQMMIVIDYRSSCEVFVIEMTFCDLLTMVKPDDYQIYNCN